MQLFFADLHKVFQSLDREEKKIVDLQKLCMKMGDAERKRKLEAITVQDPVTQRWFCPLCQSSFTRRNAAVDHIEGQHLKLTNYPCFYCEKRFTSNGLRRNHIHLHHREMHKIHKKSDRSSSSDSSQNPGQAWQAGQVPIPTGIIQQNLQPSLPLPLAMKMEETEHIPQSQ